jgi:Mor family transcriptional regulator
MSRILYSDVAYPDFPVSNKTPKKSARNEEIIAKYYEGETMVKLARMFDISEQRVHQIIRSHRNSRPPETL